MSDNKKNQNNSNMEQIDSNLTAIIGITIKSFNEKYIDKKTVTFYEVEVTSHITQKAFCVERRYNEFKNLHANLSKIYVNLPPIPGTSFFKITSEEQLNKRKVELDSFMESRDSPEYLRSYDKEALKNLDNYYINKKENLHVLSRFGNWITLRPNDKNRSHALEKLKYGVYETSIVAPIWMDISSRRKINKNYESAKRIFKSLQIKNPRDNTKVTALFDRDQKNVKPLFLLDSYEKNRILLRQKSQ